MNEINVKTVEDFSNYYRSHFVGSIVFIAKHSSGIDIVAVRSTYFAKEGEAAFTLDEANETSCELLQMMTDTNYPEIFNKLNEDLESSNEIFDSMKESGITNLRVFNREYSLNDDNPDEHASSGNKKDDEMNDLMTEFMTEKGYSSICFYHKYAASTNGEDIAIFSSYGSVKNSNYVKDGAETDAETIDMLSDIIRDVMQQNHITVMYYQI